MNEPSTGPDPGVVYPASDGDHRCRVPGSEDDTYAAAKAECEEMQGIMSVVQYGSDGPAYDCEDVSWGLTVTEIFMTMKRAQCGYVLTEGGVCAGEIPVQELDIPDVQPPLPVGDDS